METISKVSDTQVKITTIPEPVDQIVDLKAVRKQRELLVNWLSEFDANTVTQRANAVKQISTLDRIISEAEGLGVKDEATDAVQK
jgi:hypothetical protein